MTLRSEVTGGARCAWCGRGYRSGSGPGRPRRYCRRSCRQRAYEARRRAAELGLEEHEVVVARQELEALRDRLYVLACAVEDTERDLAAEPAPAVADLRAILDWLFDAARQAVAD